MHTSVLLKEAIEALHIKTGGKYIDATLGAGGHSIEILRRGGKLLAFEADEKMLQIAKINIQKAHGEVYVLGRDYFIVNQNFRNISAVAKDSGFREVDGILFDLGISSVHLDADSRGFSFKDPSKALDMRLSPKDQVVTAFDLLNSLPEAHLVELFLGGMDYHSAKSLASKVIDKRKHGKFKTVGDMLELTGKAKGKIHPATKPFMALRIAVNSEIDTLKSALLDAISLLKRGGVLIVISFHSGEDRVVKQQLKKTQLVLPTKEEILRNPRSRSAKMRIYIKDDFNEN